MRQSAIIAAVTSLITASNPAFSQIRSATVGEPPETECDRYTASRVDPLRVAAPVRDKDIKPTLAMAACLDAVRMYPNSLRLKYQLGRAFEATGNIPRSIELHRECADLGYTAAQVELANAYLLGQGVAKDMGQARRWYQRAADLGNPHAQYKIADAYIKAGNESIVARQAGAYSNAIPWLRKAADQGDPDAQFQLARFLINGLGGIAPDDAQAVTLLKRAAEQGHEAARTALAEFDVKQDLGDVVAQVLNYSSFGDDKGRGQSFWYKDASSKCSYRERISPEGRQERLSNIALLAIAAAGVQPASRIDLNDIDPRGLRFRADHSGTYILYDNKLLLYSAAELDMGRLQRGWTLIFDKHCQGRKRQF